MKPNEEIMEFLKENPTFYLATVEGYLPRVRPIGFAMWYNDHLCIGLGKHKAAYKQLLDNTNLEICAARPPSSTALPTSSSVVPRPSLPRKA